MMKKTNFFKETRRYNVCIENLTRKYPETNIGEYLEELYERSTKKKNEKNTQLRSRLTFVASATNLGLGTRKLPNAPASEFTSTTTATLTRTCATMWQHVPLVHICAPRDMRRLGTHSTYLRRCGYIFYKTFLIPRRITGETRKGWYAEVTRTRRTPAGRRRGGERENRGGEEGKKRRGGGQRDKEGQDEGREGKASLNISWNKEKCDSAEARPQHFCLYKIMYSAGLRHISQSITSSLCVSPVPPAPPPPPSPPPQLRLFHVVSSFTVLPGSATGTRLSFFRDRGHISASRNALLVYLALRHRIRPSSSTRATSTPTCRGPRLSADPSTSIVSLRRTRPDRSQLPKSSIRDPTVSLPWDNPAVGNVNNVGGARYLFPVLWCLNRSNQLIFSLRDAPWMDYETYLLRDFKSLTIISIIMKE